MQEAVPVPVPVPVPDVLLASPPDELYDPTLVLTSVSAADAGVYRCVLRTASGEATSAALRLHVAS